MITPISNNGSMNIEPIKVPRQNATSFCGLRSKVMSGDTAKAIFKKGNINKIFNEQIKPFANGAIKKAGDIFNAIKDFAVNIFKDTRKIIGDFFKEIKNPTEPTKKGKIVKSGVAAGVAIGGAIGSAIGIKKAINKDKE